MSQDVSMPQPLSYDDEISISELLLKMWRRRGVIVILPLVLAGLTVVGLLTSKVGSEDILSYYIELNGIKDEAYPNETRFSPQDLLNPSVMQQLAATYSLTEVSKLNKALVVEYGTANSEGVLAEYQAALSANSKAGPDQIALINERYESRLKDATRRGLRISVDYVALGLSKSQGEALAYALPKIWNQVFAEKFRIFADKGVLGLPVIAAELDLTTSLGVLEAELQLEAISTGIEVLNTDNRYSALVANGSTPADAAKMLEDFRRVYFDPIYASAFSRSDELANVYRRDLELNLVEVEVALEELNERIQSIIDIQGSGGSLNSGQASAGGGAAAQLQIEGDALDQLVSLSKTASLAEYLQSSFDERSELTRTKAELLTRMKKMGGDGDGDGDGDGQLLSDQFVLTADARLSGIKETYANLLSSAQETARQETASLYSVASGIQAPKLIQRRDLLFIALALALGGMLAVISALLWPESQTE